MPDVLWDFIPIFDTVQRDTIHTQIAKFTGPTWDPPGSCRPQMIPMLAPCTLLSEHCKSYHRRNLQGTRWQSTLFDYIHNVTDECILVSVTEQVLLNVFLEFFTYSWKLSTHKGRVTHVCVIWLGPHRFSNGPVRRQDIIEIDDGLLSINFTLTTAMTQSWYPVNELNVKCSGIQIRHAHDKLPNTEI